MSRVIVRTMSAFPQHFAAFGPLLNCIIISNVPCLQMLSIHRK